MTDTSQITEHMEVVGSDGQHVGTVDRVEDDTIKLAKNDSEDGAHHFVPISSVESAGDGKVCLNRTAEDVKAAWHRPDAELYFDKVAGVAGHEGGGSK